MQRFVLIVLLALVGCGDPPLKSGDKITVDANRAVAKEGGWLAYKTVEDGIEYQSLGGINPISDAANKRIDELFAAGKLMNAAQRPAPAIFIERSGKFVRIETEFIFTKGSDLLHTETVLGWVDTDGVVITRAK